MDVLDARVGEVLGDTSVWTKKYVYLQGSSVFHSRRPPPIFFAISFRQVEPVNYDAVEEWFIRTPLVSPLYKEVLTTQECMRYLTVMERRGVTGKSAFGNVCSAMAYVYISTEVSRPHDFDSHMKRCLKGLHHTVTQMAQRRNERQREGKEPFTFLMYRAVAKAMLNSTKKRDAFGHSFLLVFWGLICRAKIAESIMRVHLSWFEDAIAITLAHMKNGQYGINGRPHDPMHVHVYANLTIPGICSILALVTLFFLTLAVNYFLGPINTAVFQSWSNSGWFWHSLIEKSAAMYVSSCSTSGPSATTICLRAGWTLPGI
ncbi:hypothetical protein GN244_ATG17824 [Phytophthora infestans]|uniref:Transmembrane protein n=1 Tax=Phytophthora infestans TaxID=4787 RepID=A0A833SQC5_PHYIN|nr:hypothetical protein GN244_ATG17824 [Phytophthora infestans]